VIGKIILRPAVPFWSFVNKYWVFSAPRKKFFSMERFFKPVSKSEKEGRITEAFTSIVAEPSSSDPAKRQNKRGRPKKEQVQERAEKGVG
jgi:hypothetical protein